MNDVVRVGFPAAGTWIVSYCAGSSIIKAWPVTVEAGPAKYEVHLPGYGAVRTPIPFEGFVTRKVRDHNEEMLAEWLAERNGRGTVLESLT